MSGARAPHGWRGAADRGDTHPAFAFAALDLPRPEVEAAIYGAVAGFGVTRALSYQVARAVSDGRLQLVLAEYEPAPSPVSLIHGPQGLTPRKVRMLLDFAAPRLRARLA
jgi:DNA-binding transcriptional LysR family regulator